MNTAELTKAGALDVRGAGEAVVLLHGLGGTLNVWEPHVKALAEHYRVVRYDLRGSGRFAASAPLDVDQWVTDLGELLDALSIHRAHLVGHSLGTLVLQHFAARYPERTSSLALLGVNRSPPEARRSAIRQRAQDVREHGMAAVVDGLLASVPAAHTRDHKLLVLALIRELLLGQDLESYAWTCEAMADSTRPNLLSLTCPLLLVAGKDDTVSPPDLARAMATEFPDARLVELADCGHWIPLEQPDRTTAELLNFLLPSEQPKPKEIS